MASGQEVLAKAFQMAANAAKFGAEKATNVINKNVSKEFVSKTIAYGNSKNGIIQDSLQRGIFSGITGAAVFGGVGAISGLLNGDLVDSTISGVKLGAMAGFSTGTIAKAVATTGSKAYASIHPETFTK